MIEVTQIRLKVDHSDSELKRALYKRLNLHINEELNWKVYRCSIDARKKGTSGVTELMKQSGYDTACIGKWDVSNRKAIKERMPNAQGFNYYFGPLGANDDGVVAIHENHEPSLVTKDMGNLIKLYTEKSINYLKDIRDPKKPFLLYLSHTMMHTIIDASQKFRGKSKGGLYGDVVEEFDFETGRLLDTLDELKLRDNTLVIYTSDNGPWNQKKYTDKKKGHPKDSIFWGDSGPLRNGKGSCYEGGYRLPCIVRWPGKIKSAERNELVSSNGIRSY